MRKPFLSICNIEKWIKWCYWILLQTLQSVTGWPETLYSTVTTWDALCVCLTQLPSTVIKCPKLSIQEEKGILEVPIHGCVAAVVGPTVRVHHDGLTWCKLFTFQQLEKTGRGHGPNSSFKGTCPITLTLSHWPCLPKVPSLTNTVNIGWPNF